MFIEILLKSLKTYFVAIDTLTKIFNSTSNHKILIQNIILVFLGYYIGKYFRQKNQFEEFLNQFNNSSNLKVILKSKLVSLNHFIKIMNFIFGFMLITLIIVFSLKNNYILNSKDLNIELFIEEISKNQYNIYILGVLILVCIFYLLFNHILNEYKSNFEVKILKYNSNKEIYINRFLDILGKDITEQIKITLIKKVNNKYFSINNIKSPNKDELEYSKLKLSINKYSNKKEYYLIFFENLMDFKFCICCINESTYKNENKLFLINSIKNKCNNNCKQIFYNYTIKLLKVLNRKLSILKMKCISLTEFQSIS